MHNQEHAYRAGRIRGGLGMAAAGLAAALLVVPASADARIVSGDTAGLSYADFRCDAGGSLTYVKKPHGEYASKPLSELPEGLISGARVTVTKVEGIDLSTADGWAKAEKLTVEEAKKQLATQPLSVTTDASGKALFTGLSAGLYLLHEEAPAAAHKDYWKSEDFLFTIPAGRAGQSDPAQWDCDVEIIAKEHPNQEPTQPPTPTTSPSTPPPTIPVFPPVTTKPQPSHTSVPPVTTAPTPPQTPPTGTGKLARTGASVLGLVGVASVLVAMGAFLVTRRRRADES